MRSRVCPARGVYAILLIAALALAGCSHGIKGQSIQPAPDAQDQADVGLGPGVRPLSSGPGEKESPSWGPEGSRIAFIVDGYVVEKPLDAPDSQRRTTRDFGARGINWTSSGDSLIVLRTDSPASSEAGSGTGSGSESLSAYRTVPEEGSLEVTRLADGVRAMAPGAEDGSTLMALENGDGGSRFALVETTETMLQYSSTVEGEVTGLSLSPDGEHAVLAVRSPGTQNRFELHAFSLAEDSSRLLARLEPGLEVFGAPQWTRSGIYYVAGEQEKTVEKSAAPYDLYRLQPNSDTPQTAPGVGGDFVALSLSRAPDGSRLAIIGRRSPGSALNLYMLDPAREDLVSLTSNEDMEIKTGSGDLAWSADGRSVAIVARSVLSEPEVYSRPADAVVNGFYNIYEVPVERTLQGRAS